MPIFDWLTGKLATYVCGALLATNLVAGAGLLITRHTLSNRTVDLATEKKLHQIDIDHYDRFVIIASGDEVALEFDPSSLAPVRQGWSRDYFLYADGFAKDMDFYESLSDTVEPLPFHSMPRYPYGADTHYPTSAEYLRYRLSYNTRYISGGGVSSYRSSYSNRKTRQ